jgi:ACS family D-galactonate transporter-like MFS transporter
MGNIQGGGDDSRGWKPYHTTWVWLFLAWMMLYIDRSITGPVVAWMIEHDVPLIGGSTMPHALGGLIGGMFFAGYMLTQFPAGYLGDTYGRKAMVFLSTLLASVATLITALTRSLSGFVAARIFTGLVEGAYYSNDRALIAAVTPERKKGLAMGIIFSGLAAGLTLATLMTPYLMSWASPWMGPDTWTVPFLLFSLPTAAVAFGLWKYVRPPEGEPQRLRPALSRLLAYSGAFLGVLVLVFMGIEGTGLSELVQVGMVAMVAAVLVALIYLFLGRKSASVLHDRNLVLMYVSAVPILYTLWFFGFWALLVVSESASIGLDGAALYAAFFGVANGLGYPLGGYLTDRSRALGWSRKRLYVLLCLVVAGLVLVLGAYLFTGGSDYMLIGALIFAIGLPFSAMQTVHMTLTSDLAPPAEMGQAFGMWTLVAEFGALLSPVVAGYLRDLTGSWVLPVVVTGAFLVTSALLVMQVRPRGSFGTA